MTFKKKEFLEKLQQDQKLQSLKKINIEDIDCYISAEKPYENEDPELF